MNGSSSYLLSVPPVINLTLFSPEEVLEAVTNLSGEYALPILQDYPDPAVATRASTSALPPGNMSTKERRADPLNIPLPAFPGDQYEDEQCRAFGLANRAELRRLQDFLAPSGLTPTPVSSSGSPS